MASAKWGKTHARFAWLFPFWIISDRSVADIRVRKFSIFSLRFLLENQSSHVDFPLFNFFQQYL
jgi:hypothetical protein